MLHLVLPTGTGQIDRWTPKLRSRPGSAAMTELEEEQVERGGGSARRTKRGLVAEVLAEEEERGRSDCQQ